jgi:hypothetical protein
VNAPHVVVACGALETPALLLRSGIGGPAVGHNLYLHPSAGIFGVYAEDQKAWWGPPQAAIMDEFRDLGDGYGFLVEGSQYYTGVFAFQLARRDGAQAKEAMSKLGRMADFLFVLRDHAGGQVTIDDAGEAVHTYALTDERDIAGYRKGLRVMATLHEAAGAEEMWFGTTPRVWKKGDDVDAWVDELDRSTSARAGCSWARRTRWAAPGWAPTPPPRSPADRRAARRRRRLDRRHQRLPDAVRREPDAHLHGAGPPHRRAHQRQARRSAGRPEARGRRRPRRRARGLKGTDMTLNHTRDRLYIDGAWVPSTGSGTLPGHQPLHRAGHRHRARRHGEDVDAAARAAARALPGWSETSLDDRVKACRAIAEGLKARAQEVALYASTEMGAPWQIAVMVQAGLPVIDFASMEDVADQVEWERRSGNSLLVRKPVGVVGAITPWNYPLHQISAKVAPTLLAGGTIVVKPSELVPGVAYVLAEVIHDAGLPPGVFNLVTGTGPVVGEAIVKHEAVDMVSFTGSTRAGRRVAELASAAPSARRWSSAARAPRCCSTTCRPRSWATPSPAR